MELNTFEEYKKFKNEWGAFDKNLHVLCQNKVFQKNEYISLELLEQFWDLPNVSVIPSKVENKVGPQVSQKKIVFTLLYLGELMGSFSPDVVSLFFEKHPEIVQSLQEKRSLLARKVLLKATQLSYSHKDQITGENVWYERFLGQFVKYAPKFDLRNNILDKDSGVKYFTSPLFSLCDKNQIPELKSLIAHGCSLDLVKTKGKYFTPKVFNEKLSRNYFHAFKSVESFELCLANGYEVLQWNQAWKDVAVETLYENYKIKNLANLLSSDWTLSLKLIKKHQEFYNLSKDEMKEWHENTLAVPFLKRFFDKKDEGMTEYIRYLAVEYSDFLEWKVFPATEVAEMSLKQYFIKIKRDDLVTLVDIIQNVTPNKNSVKMGHRF